MRKYLKEILYLLGSDKNKIPKIIGMYVIASMLDVIGLGIIAPYLAIVIDPTIIYNDNFSFYIENLGLPNNNEKILIILG